MDTSLLVKINSPTLTTYRCASTTGLCSLLSPVDSDADADLRLWCAQIHGSLDGILEQLLKGVHTGKDSAFTQPLTGQALNQHRPDVYLAVLGNQVSVEGRRC